MRDKTKQTGRSSPSIRETRPVFRRTLVALWDALKKRKKTLIVIAYGMSLIGGLLLYAAITFEPSPLRVIGTPGDNTMLCQGDDALMIITTTHMSIGDRGACAPERLLGGKPYGVLPAFSSYSLPMAHWGIWLALGGTLLQMIVSLLPQPVTDDGRPDRRRR
jgi:hypothetical protein